MDNYREIAGKETKLKNKSELLDDTIEKDKLTKYEIIQRMFKGLVDEIDDLKKILFEDLSVTNKSKHFGTDAT